MRFARICAALLGLGAIVLGCGRGGREAVRVVGSTSIQPFAEMLAEEYARLRPDALVEVQGGGSTAGLQAVTSGIAEIGMCSRSLGQAESSFRPITIARDGLAVVVHPSNTLESLSMDQIRAIFAGEVRNWRELGGPDLPLRPITREEGSGTREAFTKLVMKNSRIARSALTQESNGAVKELVKHDPAGIGYMSLGLVGGELRMLAIDGVTPTEAHVLDGSYAVVRPFLFVVQGEMSAPARAFVDFVLSPASQMMLRREGLVAAQ